MMIDILGKRWRLRFVPKMPKSPSDRGQCDSPQRIGKEIRIRDSLAGEERLEVILHELLHAAGWHLDEAFVERFAEDVARVLWRLGYRDSACTSIGSGDQS